MKTPKQVLKEADGLGVLKDGTVAYLIAECAVTHVQHEMREMLSIFQWMHDNPGCHPQNMRAEAKRMLDKYGEEK